MDLVTIAEYPTALEAELAKGRLEAEGVPVVLGNAMAAAVMPFLGAGLGGVSLQVAREDEERAREILGPGDEEGEPKA